ncbi:mitochondrial ribosomal protein L37-domain-containing protein [Lactarius psammicola]|nr:mitochondrial ribosomal protein L37-domain-containing protein [Lactarius psammicola]
MLASYVLRRSPRALCVRSYVSKAMPSVPKAVPEQMTTRAPSTGAALSSCPPNTILVGLNYLKDQPPVLALADEEYPPWLWKLLDKTELPDDGPGGKAEKRRLRKENRQRIRDQNFMKTQ